jgi:iron complex outermembrane receptor protein
MPPARWLSTLKFTKDTWGKRFRNAYLSLEVEANQAQHNALLAYNTETTTPAYTLLNVGMGTTVTNNAKKALFSLYFTANNVLDLAYQSHQSRLKYLDTNAQTGRQGVFNMGRNLSIKMVVPIN